MDGAATGAGSGAASPAAAPASAAALIVERERELAQLRAHAIAQLEEEVRVKDMVMDCKPPACPAPIASCNRPPPPSRNRHPTPQAAAKASALAALEGQLKTLQADFQYNLELVEGRDAELAAAEAALAAAGAEAEARAELLTAMQAGLADAEQGEPWKQWRRDGRPWGAWCR